MRFGSHYKVIHQNGVTKTQVVKFNDYAECVNEEIYEERVRVIRPGDIDAILEEMHIRHALDKGYGVYLDKAKDGKLYAVKQWTK
jgi:hypothetical protein